MRLASLVVLVLALVATAFLLPQVLDAVPGQLREVRGTVEWSPGPGGPRALIVRGDDDGRYYYADTSKLAVQPPALTRGDQVAVTGRDGLNPFKLAADAVAVLTAGRQAAPPGQSGTTPSAPERLDGRVESIDGNRVSLRTADGSIVAVDMAGETGLPDMARPGEELTVIGRATDAGQFIATGHIYIESTPSVPSARQQR